MIQIDEAVVRQVLEALENLQGIDTETECVTIHVEDEIDALRRALADSALDKMAENARELGLQMQPEQDMPKIGCVNHDCDQCIDLNKAARQALEALEHEANVGNDDAYRAERDALRRALKQPVEPYKGIADHIYQATDGRMRIDPVTGDVGVGTPSKQPAQDERLAFAFARAIEAKLREKNA